ncbi:unnamed protein product [Ixodes pacificus]
MGLSHGAGFALTCCRWSWLMSSCEAGTSVALEPLELPWSRVPSVAPVDVEPTAPDDNPAQQLTLMSASPLSRWQRMASIDSDMRSPYTFRGRRSHSCMMASKARLCVWIR